MEFKNVPNLSLKGKTFDASHLKTIIHSEQDEFDNYGTIAKPSSKYSHQQREYNHSVANKDMNTKMYSTSYSNLRRKKHSRSKASGSMKSHYSSLTEVVTNIRPSHYFISLPRHGISYMKSEPVQSDSILAKNTNEQKATKEQIEKIKEYVSCDGQIQEWKTQSNIGLPSSQRKESDRMRRTLKNFQSLRKTIFENQRKTNHSNNRWRESCGKVVHSMSGENRINTKSQRAKPFYKFIKKHNKDLKKFMSTDINWTRKKRVEGSEKNTFKRIQKVKTDTSKPLTLHGDKFCFKKCTLSHAMPRKERIII
ncbi:unnamed protein product [Moneuplotes crassus]|uniref:Uncharacterized protein n=1 Tax=Euplotes crassus TaxID=5936 RepID=A0AAD1XJF9_EUPCR|nr:unnamed protein product [Moneuplotes crassus]